MIKDELKDSKIRELSMERSRLLKTVEDLENEYLDKIEQKDQNIKGLVEKLQIIQKEEEQDKQVLKTQGDIIDELRAQIGEMKQDILEKEKKIRQLSQSEEEMRIFFNSSQREERSEKSTLKGTDRLMGLPPNRESFNPDFKFMKITSSDLTKGKHSPLILKNIRSKIPRPYSSIHSNLDKKSETPIPKTNVVLKEATMLFKSQEEYLPERAKTDRILVNKETDDLPNSPVEHVTKTIETSMNYQLDSKLYSSNPSLPSKVPPRLNTVVPQLIETDDEDRKSLMKSNLVNNDRIREMMAELIFLRNENARLKTSENKLVESDLGMNFKIGNLFIKNFQNNFQKNFLFLEKNFEYFS